jgi:hypothetical protein
MWCGGGGLVPESNRDSAISKPGRREPPFLFVTEKFNGDPKKNLDIYRLLIYP